MFTEELKETYTSLYPKTMSAYNEGFSMLQKRELYYQILRNLKYSKGIRFLAIDFIKTVLNDELTEYAEEGGKWMFRRLCLATENTPSLSIYFPSFNRLYQLMCEQERVTYFNDKNAFLPPFPETNSISEWVKTFVPHIDTFLQNIEEADDKDFIDFEKTKERDRKLINQSIDTFNEVGSLLAKKKFYETDKQEKLYFILRDINRLKYELLKK